MNHRIANPEYRRGMRNADAGMLGKTHGSIELETRPEGPFVYSPTTVMNCCFALTHLVATLALGAGPAPVRARSQEPRLTVESSRIQAGPEWTWNSSFQVHNPYETGLYLDSLGCEVEDLDPGETHAPRKTHLDLSNLMKLVSPVPARESASFQHSTPATAERAKLTFRLLAHRADGTRVSFGTVVETEPGELSLRLPSRFLEVSGRRVEYVLIPAADSLPAPGLLLVHGHGNHARKMLRRGELLATRGYTVMLVSMPGYGQSQGPADFMGASTVEALMVAEAGSDSAGWAERSPALYPEKIRAPLLILHGERDPRAPAEQAHGFHQALQARGHAVEARYFPAAEHALPNAEVQRVALDFLARHLER
jgi:dienelactone hydrolase